MTERSLVAWEAVFPLSTKREITRLVVVMKRLSENDLLYRQSLPLNVKVRMTEKRITEFVEQYGEENVYISFSGGKDSTVLLHIARKIYPNMKAVFLDTWMEYPQIREFVNQFDNVIKIKPEKTMKQIIEDDGWCFPSKDVAEAIEAYRRGCDWAIKKLNGLDGDGNPSEYRQRYKKWLRFAEDCPEKISHFCCIDMKENPVAEYEKKTGDKPIIALMACESARRKEAYLRTGCNSFDGNRPMSKPMGFWIENDVFQYIVENNVEYASPYGKICEVGQIEGQMSFCTDCKYRTTGESRTGCMFCPVGMHLDSFSKFERLKKYNPKLHDYVMEELGLIKLIEWVKEHII